MLPSEPEIAGSDLRAALDSAMYRSLKPVSVGLDALYVVLGFSHIWMLPEAVALRLFLETYPEKLDRIRQALCQRIQQRLEHPVLGAER